MRSWSLGLSFGLHVLGTVLGLHLLSRPLDLSRPVRLLDIEIIAAVLESVPATPDGDLAPQETPASRSPPPAQGTGKSTPPASSPRPTVAQDPPPPQGGRLIQSRPARRVPVPPARSAPEPDTRPEEAPGERPLEQPSPDAPPQNADPELEAFARSGGLVRPEAQDGLKHGAEARLAGLLTYEGHTVDTYVGQYAYGGRHTVSIIDARATPLGRLLLHDSRTGLLRDLKPFNHYIHTYGPALGQDQPVEGSVTFLSMGEDINRFIWMPGNGAPAQFPAKARLEESPVRFQGPGRTLSGTLFRPREGGPFSAVVLLGDPEDMARGFEESCARQLALTGIAVLAPDRDTQDRPPDPADQARDALAAVAHLRGQPWVARGRVGLVGMNAGVQAMARAAALDRTTGPDFVAAILDADAPGPAPARLTDPLVSGLVQPSLWVFVALDPARAWREDLDRLERCGHPGRTGVLSVPLDPGEAAPGWAGQALRAERAGSVFARLAGPWILRGAR